MITISNLAIEDIATFYGNALLAHPNTLDSNKVDEFIEWALDEIEKEAIKQTSGKTPILQSLNDGKTIELAIRRKGKIIWYFSMRRTDESNFIVDNAWHYLNASNRAYRRGVSNPDAPLSNDARNTQRIIKCNSQYNTMKTNKRVVRLTESKLKNIIVEAVKAVLNEQYTEGVLVRQYANNLYQILIGGKCRAFVDNNGNLYDENMQLHNGRTRDLIQLYDYDASELAHQLNQIVGNKFHWDMFRGKGNR